MAQQLLKGSLLHVMTDDGFEGVIYAQRSGSQGGECLVAFTEQLREGRAFGAYQFKELRVLGRKDMNHKLWESKLPTPAGR